MPGAGLEPARPFGQGILSPLCLPFHHPGFARSTVAEAGCSSQDRAEKAARRSLPLGEDAGFRPVSRGVSGSSASVGPQCPQPRRRRTLDRPVRSPSPPSAGPRPRRSGGVSERLRPRLRKRGRHFKPGLSAPRSLSLSFLRGLMASPTSPEVQDSSGKRRIKAPPDPAWGEGRTPFGEKTKEDAPRVLTHSFAPAATTSDLAPSGTDRGSGHASRSGDVAFPDGYRFIALTSDFARSAPEAASGAYPSAPISSQKDWVTGAPPMMTFTLPA